MIEPPLLIRYAAVSVKQNVKFLPLLMLFIDAHFTLICLRVFFFHVYIALYDLWKGLDGIFSFI